MAHVQIFTKTRHLIKHETCKNRKLSGTWQFRHLYTWIAAKYGTPLVLFNWTVVHFNRSLYYNQRCNVWVDAGTLRWWFAWSCEVIFQEWHPKFAQPQAAEEPNDVDWRMGGRQFTSKAFKCLGFNGQGKTSSLKMKKETFPLLFFFLNELNMKAFFLSN